MTQNNLRTTIHDRDGREYNVTEYGSERFNIQRRGVPIGYANFHFEGADVLHLDDLHIEDDAIFPPWFSCPLPFVILSFPPLRWRTENFQGRGIGTAMIQFLVDYARSKFAKRIEGEVKPHDFKDNPDLPDWYRRRGFTVTAGDEKTAWIAKISRAV